VQPRSEAQREQSLAPDAVEPDAVEPEALAEPGATAQPEVAPAAPRRVVVPRLVQLVVLALGLLALYAAAKAAGKVLLLFMVAGVIALILNPIVTMLHRRSPLPRGVAILAVYLAFFFSLGGIGYLLSTPIANQVKTFQHNVPSIIRSANKSLDNVQKFLNRKGIHVQIEEQGKTGLQSLQDKILKGSSSIVSFSGSLLTKIISTSFSLVLILVLSVYMLVYGPRIGDLVRRAMPRGDGTREDDYPRLVQQAVGGYLRGQLLFSITMGATAGLALYLIGLIGIFPDGRKYGLAFGIFFGVMELVPFIGPLLGALPPILVALFTSPLTAVWVALMFLAIQQLEGHVVAPQIFSRAIRLNPLVVIFALLFGNQIYGIVGALIALPVAAVIRETVVYLRRHTVLEPWNTSAPPPAG
jgi:predicted PurR-regulated permease PerM